MSNLIFRIENLLDQTLCDEKTPQTLLKAMRYAVLNGGKRIRPLLVYATGECLGAPLETLDAPALAVELIHCYSLVHDDLPAMDNDDLRRGKPTVHKAFDEATAILVGDALQNKAFEILATPNPLYSPALQLKLINCLSQATGAQGMIGGQMLDIQSEGKHLSQAEIEQMHALKTGKLISASIMLGAHASDCSQDAMQHLLKFGAAIGLAFQLKDDLLDIESDTQTLGKTAQIDQRNHKATALLEATQVKTRTTALLQQALDQLNQLPQNTTRLAQLAEFITARAF